MTRFLMLVGVAAVAAAMYVAASPASQQSRGPTAKQFNALKKEVATLSKNLKATKTEADARPQLHPGLSRHQQCRCLAGQRVR
jgi:hypothetical protein